MPSVGEVLEHGDVQLWMAHGKSLNPRMVENTVKRATRALGDDYVSFPEEEDRKLSLLHWEAPKETVVATERFDIKNALDSGHTTTATVAYFEDRPLTIAVEETSKDGDILRSQVSSKGHVSIGFPNHTNADAGKVFAYELFNQFALDAPGEPIHIEGLDDHKKYLTAKFQGTLHWSERVEDRAKAIDEMKNQHRQFANEQSRLDTVELGIQRADRLLANMENALNDNFNSLAVTRQRSERAMRLFQLNWAPR